MAEPLAPHAGRDRADAATSDRPVLRVDRLVVDVHATGARQRARVLDGVCLEIRSGEVLGVAGESGSGKTMLCRALVGSLGRRGARLVGGDVEFLSYRRLAMSEKRWARTTAGEIGYVPQSSLSGLNPVLTVGAHLEQVLDTMSRGERRPGASTPMELLDLVRMPRPRDVLGSRPHQLSGGMRQRVLIALALAGNPKLLIADEATTALDVTVQKHVVELLVGLCSELGTALLMISHDIGLLESVADRLTVMYAGTTVETVPADWGSRSRHPYARGLRSARLDPRRDSPTLATMPGEAATVGHWPSGCRFSPRCPHVRPECTSSEPDWREVDGIWIRCARAEDRELVESP